METNAYFQAQKDESSDRVMVYIHWDVGSQLRTYVHNVTHCAIEANS